MDMARIVREEQAIGRLQALDEVKAEIDRLAGWYASHPDVTGGDLLLALKKHVYELEEKA